MVRFWRWFWGLDESREYRVLRAKGEALGYALPRGLAETAADVPRVRARKRLAVRWREPSNGERERYEAVIDLFADFFEAVADRDGETWLLASRAWFGWPDPDEYAAVFLDAEGRVIAAAELERLPRGWILPEAPLPKAVGAEGG